MKVLEQRDARRLRTQEGMSIGDIASILGVAKSSVSLWVRDIELSAQQTDVLRRANPALNRQMKGQATCSRRARAERLAAQGQGRLQANSGNGLHRMGCMLYWAEGSKSRNAVQFVNSDPNMMKLFVRFLTECYGVVPERICLSVNCFLNNGLAIEEIHAYWLSLLGLPASVLRKPILNRSSRSSSRQRNTLLYGTARVVVHSTFIVQSIYGAIQEYSSLDQPDWLDGNPRKANTALRELAQAAGAASRSPS